MAIDITTDIGKVRIRIGDTGDIPFLSDDVINYALTENDNSISNTSVMCANLILAQLAYSGHERIELLEVWGNDVFNQYKQFLVMLVKNPTMKTVCPVPYTPTDIATSHPIIQFTEDYNNNWVNGTQSQELEMTAVAVNSSSTVKPYF